MSTLLASPPPSAAAPPGDAPLPPLARGAWPGAHVAALVRDPLGTVVALSRAHGDVVRIRGLGRTFVVLAHPEHAREVLVTQQKRFGRGYAHRGLKLLLGEGLLTSEGEFHRRQRRIVQPAFHRERIARYAEAMTAAAERWDARWQGLAPAGAPPPVVDVAAEMMALTLTIVGETLFGSRVEGEVETVARAMEDLLAGAPLAFIPFGRYALALPVPRARRFRAARATLDRIVLGLIAERRRRGGDRGDLLSMLLVATDPEAAEGGGAPMDDAQLRDEVMTLFLAGHETTANALAWTWRLLAEHPAAAARMHAEVDALGGASDGRAPSMADLPALPWTRAVVSEAMRLRPPAYAIGRLCLERTTVGGYRIEPGWGVITSPWLAHHDGRWWPEPEAFRPERWLEPTSDADGTGTGAERPRLAYFPFGAGPRLCIGEQFAWTEAILVLATLARRWAPALVPGAPAPTPRGAITLRPGGGVRLALVRRARGGS